MIGTQTKPKASMGNYPSSSLTRQAYRTTEMVCVRMGNYHGMDVPYP
jgi:hypothetical protein